MSQAASYYGEYLGADQTLSGCPETEAISTVSRTSTINGRVHQIAADLIQLNRSSSSQAVIAPSGNNCNEPQPNTNCSGLSNVEAAILRSTVPIDINETEEIVVNGQRGIWANRAEVVNWRGVIPIEQYEINSDATPEIITKRSQQQLIYQQEVAIRYLRPPTPPAPGEILIQQELNTLTPPAPPLVIRQQPPRPITPQPLVIREAPPQPPCQVGRKVITISGKRLPPPPRKVVIERLPPLPSKPQSVIIERWLPYNQVKRRVIFQKTNDRDAVTCKPKNVIIQWDAPQVKVNKEFKDLGVIRANPAEYVARYGATLKTARELPSFVLEIKPPAGIVLAADSSGNSGVYELEGDVQALRFIDLDREGLSEYKTALAKLNGSEERPSLRQTPSLSVQSESAAQPQQQNLTPALISDIFNQIDRDSNGRLLLEEAGKILSKLNSRLGRRCSDEDVKRVLDTLEVDEEGQVDVQNFRKAFENQ